uniref:Uncharacterized protein n=1 Tax=Tanacetum cinerariifolium TaxID=118510 RepID=A0A6L2NSJ7_TANCI|nr:hypothetical protein [Tanacetum cinerariifolium]
MRLLDTLDRGQGHMAKGPGSCWGSLIEVVGKSVDSGGVAGNVGMEVQVKMEMEIPRSSGVYFITACSYSTDTSKELMKVQVYASRLQQL